MELEVFRKKRKNVLLLNLVYFIVLLIIGVFLFLTGAGRWIWIPAAAAVAFYLVSARPARAAYERELREAILKHSVLRELDEAVYDRSSGIDPEYLVRAGFVSAINDSAFLSREHIRGKSRKLQVEMADVTFPFRENGLNKMFNGCLIHITTPGKEYTPLSIFRGETREDTELTPREEKLIDRLGSFIPGSLYLHREGGTLDVLLRGRFIGFTINPLEEVTEAVFRSDPLPELKTALELASL